MFRISHRTRPCAITALIFSACLIHAQENIEIKDSGDVTVENPLNGLNISIDAGKDLTTENTVEALENIGLNAGGITHVMGAIKAGGKIDIKSGGDIIIDGEVNSGSDIVIESGGNIDINQTIEGEHVDASAEDEMNVDANVTGRNGVNLTTENGALTIDADASVNSPAGKVNLDSPDLRIDGTINEGRPE